MNTMYKLKPSEVQLAMTELSDWTLDTHTEHHTFFLSKSWTLPCFKTAVPRFNQIAQLAQAQDHHPEVLSSYTHLQVHLWTHDVAGLTHKDFALTRAIDQLSTAP